MLSFYAVFFAIQMGFLSLQLVASFDNHASCSEGRFHNLNLARQRLVPSMSIGKLPIASSILSTVGNEVERAFSIICHAPVKRKAILLAHPVLVVMLCLLANSKFGRSFGDSLTRTLLKMLRLISLRSRNACALAVAFAKAKVVKSNFEAGDIEKEKTMKAPQVNISMDNKSSYTTDLKIKIKKDEDKAASAAIKRKIAEVEAREIAYSQAQKLKKESAQKAGLAKARAIEAEDNRLMRIDKNSREMDSFRKVHDISFRRWKAEQTLPRASKMELGNVQLSAVHDTLTPIDTSKMHLEHSLDQELATQTAVSGVRHIGGKEEEVKMITAAEAEYGAEKSKIEESLRLIAKAAAEQTAKEAQVAYAKQVKEKAAAVKVR